MSGGFVKIYGSILRSSVWQQPLATKVVWITMLALADENGLVEASIPGLAATAGVTLEECETALACFTSPDRYSGSDVEDGRRIRACRGGWVIINHKYYRELRTERQVREAERLAEKRARASAANTSATVQHVANVADVAPNANAEIDPPISPLGETPGDEAHANAPPPAAAGAPSRASRSKSPGGKRQSAHAEPLPSGWGPTDAHRAYAAKHALDVELEADGLRGWAEGRTAISWNGTFATRLANAVKFRRERGSPGPKRPSSQPSFDAEDIA